MTYLARHYMRKEAGAEPPAGDPFEKWSFERVTVDPLLVRSASQIMNAAASSEPGRFFYCAISKGA